MVLEEHLVPKQSVKGLVFCSDSSQGYNLQYLEVLPSDRRVCLLPCVLAEA